MAVARERITGFSLPEIIYANTDYLRIIHWYNSCKETTPLSVINCKLHLVNMLLRVSVCGALHWEWTALTLHELSQGAKVPLSDSGEA